MFDIDMITKETATVYPFLLDHFSGTTEEDERGLFFSQIDVIAGFVGYEARRIEGAAEDLDDSLFAQDQINDIIEKIADDEQYADLVKTCRDAKNMMRLIGMMPAILKQIEGELIAVLDAKS